MAEQFGRVIVEAQASGAVVAGYACGAIPEVAGQAAIVVPIGEVDQLAESVSRLVVHTADFTRRREAGQRQALERTWNAVAERQLELYRQVRAEPRFVLRLPRSPRQKRRIARAEFGPTASTPAGARPFALPLLRRGGSVPRLLATLIDTSVDAFTRMVS